MQWMIFPWNKQKTLFCFVALRMWLSLLVSSVLFVFAVWRFLLRLRSERRKQVWISASSVSAAVGINPFKSPLELYNEMTSGEKQLSSNVAATSHGIDNEAKAFALYKTLYAPTLRSGANMMFFSPSMPWLRGYTDGLVYGERSGKIDGVLEIKCRCVAAASAFLAWWR